MNTAVNSASSGVSAVAAASSESTDESCGTEQGAANNSVVVQKSELATRLASKIVKNSREDLLKIVVDPNADEQLWLSAWQEHKERQLGRRYEQTSLRLVALEFVQSLWKRLRACLKA